MTTEPMCEDCREYLEEIYEQLDDSISLNEERMIIHKHKSSARYKDTPYELIRDVIEHCNIGEDDIFFDLGSGLGRPCIQVAMETTLKESRGVEISETRNKKAIGVLNMMRKQGLTTKVNLICDTFLKEEYWKDVTIGYSWAYAFKNLLPEIAKLAKECKTLKYFILLGTTFEEANIDLKAHNLKRDNMYDPLLAIYKKI